MILSVVAVALASLTLLPGRARRARRQGARDPRQEGSRHRRREPLGPVDRRGAASPGDRRSRSGSSCSALLILPAVGMQLGHAGRTRRRPRPHQPRRLRAAREVVRPRRRRTRLHHRADVGRADRRADRRARTPHVVDARIVSPPRRTAGPSCASSARPRSTTRGPRRSCDRLRDRLASAVPAARVGGPAAQNHDLTAVLTGRAPIAIGVILLVAFVLLLVVFRSLVDRRVLDPDEPRHRRRRVRVRDARVPTRLRRRPARHRAPGVRRRLGTPVLLRPALRPLDGLPALPARRDPRALRGDRRHPASHSAKASPAPAGRSRTQRSS